MIYLIVSMLGTKTTIRMKLESCNSTAGNSSTVENYAFDSCYESQFNSFLKIKLDALQISVRQSLTRCSTELASISNTYIKDAVYLFGNTSMADRVINRLDTFDL
jgi:hypothetical protein